MNTVVGLILLSAPFLLLGKFQDKKLGFSSILIFSISFQLIIAVVTQAFHVFSYPVVLTANIVIAATILISFGKKFKEIIYGFISSFKKADFVFIIALFIAFTQLYSIHFNYSGKISTIDVIYQEVKNFQYPYPYFSDEWYSIAFIRDSIESKSLPVKNPFFQSQSAFINLELPFHSFLSAVVLLLGLNPLTQYTLLTIFTGLLTISLIYLLLRANNIEQLPAAIAGMSSLYITNGANLPGMWNLIPINIGLILMLLGLTFISLRNLRMALFTALITLIFYPPLVVFYTPALVFFVFTSKESVQLRIKTILTYFFLVILAGIAISSLYFISKGQLNNFFEYIIFSKIFYPPFVADAIPTFTINNVIPIPILLLAILGIAPLLKRGTWWLLPMIFVGLSFWSLYSYQTFRIIIEFERIVFVTSILIVIAAGFGLNHILRILKTTNIINNDKILFIQIGVLLLLLFLSFQYTDRDNWQKLSYTDLKTDNILLPFAPANRYLQSDDIKLFSNINNQRFLSLPWKGTVIGVATKNYPLSTKQGTITINSNLIVAFMEADCSGKNKIAKQYYINYVYFPQFECKNFELEDISSEGLYLYKFTDPDQQQEK